MLSDQEILKMYGKSAVISRKCGFTLVHLDRPSQQLVEWRTEEFDPDQYFEDQCPLCQILKEGGIVIFDEDSSFDEEILLE